MREAPNGNSSPELFPTVKVSQTLNDVLKRCAMQWIVGLLVHVEVLAKEFRPHLNRATRSPHVCHAKWPLVSDMAVVDVSRVAMIHFLPILPNTSQWTPPTRPCRLGPALIQ